MLTTTDQEHPTIFALTQSSSHHNLVIVKLAQLLVLFLLLIHHFEDNIFTCCLIYPTHQQVPWCMANLCYSLHLVILHQDQLDWVAVMFYSAFQWSNSLKWCPLSIYLLKILTYPPWSTLVGAFFLLLLKWLRCIPTLWLWEYIYVCKT